jgi:hypothetical protein
MRDTKRCGSGQLLVLSSELSLSKNHTSSGTSGPVDSQGFEFS